MSVTNDLSATTTNDSTIERAALGWIDDPLKHFGQSATRMHSMRREEQEAIQLAAMNILLAKRRAEIPVLAKLADAQGIHSLSSFDAMVPLLFEHNVYKSYPSPLLTNSRFDQL